LQLLAGLSPGRGITITPDAFASRADTRYVSVAHESALAPPAQSAQGGSHEDQMGTILSWQRVLV